EYFHKSIEKICLLKHLSQIEPCVQRVWAKLVQSCVHKIANMLVPYHDQIRDHNKEHDFLVNHRGLLYLAPPLLEMRTNLLFEHVDIEWIARSNHSGHTETVPH